MSSGTFCVYVKKQPRPVAKAAGGFSEVNADFYLFLALADVKLRRCGCVYFVKASIGCNCDFDF